MRIYILLLAAVIVGPAVSHGQPVRHVSDAGSRTMTAVAYPRHMSGRRTASGERYDPTALTAAHRTLPFGSRLELVSPVTGRSVMVTINDRGSALEGADLIASTAAMNRLGLGSERPSPVMVSAWPTSTPAPEELIERQPDKALASPARPQPAASDSRLPNFSIQLGAYSDLSAAEAVASTMQETWIQTAAVKGQSVHRVFFGRYGQREDAEGWLARLERLGISGYVRTLAR